MKKFLAILALGFIFSLGANSSMAAHCAGGHDKAKDASTTKETKETKETKDTTKN